MTNINAYLRENLPSISDKNMYVAPEIDEKKLNNAVKSFGYGGSPSNVAGILDNTLMKSGKDGLLFTGEKVIYRASFSDPIDINYSSIKNIEYIETVTGQNNDKLDLSIAVHNQDGGMVLIKSLLDCNYKRLTEILKATITEFQEHKEEKQLISIDELSETLKIAYLKIIINMAYDDDDLVDDKEFSEILLLMARLNLTPDSRFILRNYMASIDTMEPLEALILRIEKESPSGQVKSLHISLVKDLINIYFSTGGTKIESFAFLQKNRSILAVTDEEIELTVMAIINDRNMLKENYSDDQIKEAIKILSAKAAAVGTPLAAVYLSGSVIGMSAAGLTSGLATLGMGGILGLSGMASGIGVAVLLGVGAYAGIRKLTGTNEITRSKRRELMLTEVIKQTQKAISLLIQDINHITLKLNEQILAHGTQDARIKKLVALMSQMTGAGSVLTGKVDNAQGSAIKIRCAKFLDENKLRNLTREPTKSDIFDFIRNFYEEKSFVEERNEGNIETYKLTIMDGIKTSELETLAKAFEVIGYFNTSDVLKGSAIDAAEKAKNKISSFFS